VGSDLQAARVGHRRSWLDGNGFARIDTDTGPEGHRGVPAVLFGEDQLEIDRNTERLSRRGEHRERLVTPKLDHLPAPRLHALSRDLREGRRQLRCGLAPVRLREARVATDVRDHERPDLRVTHR